ncbi:MAG: MerR family transcriptional regulator [Alphaproteobacteria bacterium]|nr:MerR family transcriptional regulator [Alphaproteobacteria bacterium]
MRKSEAAFRTISEVSQDIDVPQHVLRFWESRFTQIKPLKRGGGRRYYRPEDLALLRRIRDLLYREGYTIKGVQKLLRDGNGRLDGLPPEPAAEPAPEVPPQVEAEIEPAVAPPVERARGELERLLAELVEMRDLLNQAVR